MAWRGTTTVADRIFASLPYLLPLIEGLVFGRALFQQFPVLQILLVVLQPVLIVYSIIASSFFGFGSLIVFLLLFFLVVRNERIAHFIRFNTMQAILIGIVLSLCGLILQYVLAPILSNAPFVMETLMTTIFLGVVVAFFYSVIQSLMGRYAEIPTISEAVYMQVR
ncbi:Tic20 family protein [Aerosakkonemataceae cyanobacterium BLCC-F154]|uniref:Tic20 family protein n=1 Tax=Floridaenema fluviatile BLCC-F154 TaxID=3153640 RepID=A0ABV4YML8_9CYAN